VNVHWSALNPSAKRPSISSGGDVPYSPYIVRLSAPGAPEVASSYENKEEAPLVELVLNGADGLTLRSEDERALLEQLLPEDDGHISHSDVEVSVSLGPDRAIFEPADVPVSEEVQIARLATALALLDQHEVERARPPETITTHFAPLNLPTTGPTSAGLPFQHPLRMAVSLASITMLVTAPLHAAQLATDSFGTAKTAEGAALRGAQRLLGGTAAASTANLNLAGADFTQAITAFREAQSALRDLPTSLTTVASLIPSAGSAITSARALTDAGEALAQGSATLTAGFSDFTARGTLPPTERLALLSSYLASAAPSFGQAAAALEKVDPSTVPAAYQPQIIEAQKYVGGVYRSLVEFSEASTVLQALLGADQSMKYLVAFQNNTELRPTGGFIGSFAEVTLTEGQLERVTVPPGGSYAIQGQMVARVAAPPPLQLLRAKWEFQDANWFPDFPMSARKLQWFYEKSGGPSTDGVIAVNASFLEEVLAVIGPVNLADGTEVNSENVLRIMRTDIDERATDLATTTAPKKIVGELVEIILKKLESADTATFLAVLSAVLENFSDRDLQVYLTNNDAQRLVTAAGFDGGLKQAPDDYLMVVNTNLGGGKTDRVIDQDIQVQSQILPDGSVENQVTIKKTHRGLPGRSTEGVNNVDFIRLYVPEGAKVISVSGAEVPPLAAFESDSTLALDDDLALHLEAYNVNDQTSAVTWQEAGKTVIGAWMQTAPQEEQIVSFLYRVPRESFASFRSGSGELHRHTLFIQAPSGVHTRTIRTIITPPAGSATVYQTNNSLTESGHIIQNEDTLFGLVYSL
jgi:hypothetical protein